MLHYTVNYEMQKKKKKLCTVVEQTAPSKVKFRVLDNT